MLLLKEYKNELNKTGNYVSFKRKLLRRGRIPNPLNEPVGGTVTVNIVSGWAEPSRKWYAYLDKLMPSSNYYGSSRMEAITKVIQAVVKAERIKALREENNYEVEY